ALGLLAWSSRLAISPRWDVLVNALTLSFAVTNWMAGIAATFVRWPWRAAARLTVYAFCLVVLLSGVQKLVFPSARFFLGGEGASAYLLRPEAGGPVTVAMSFLFHTMVMPAIGEIDRGNRSLSMTTQRSRLGSSGPWGVGATVVWTALLAMGLWGAFTVQEHARLRVALGAVLAGQLLFHALFGPETFLYAAHFVPWLLVLSAFSVLTPARRVGLGLAAGFVVLAGVNNILQFQEASGFVRRQVTPRYLVQLAMRQRPDDPWPRSAGHVILALPGTSEEEKAYHEPGGSLSPAVGSFGLSIWIIDGEGRVAATSDTIPGNLLRQRFRFAGGGVPAIETESPYYRTRWSSAGPGRWALDLSSFPEARSRIALLLRSVGPAGGPVEALDWDGRRLRVNGRWSVTLHPRPAAVHLGEEGPTGWMAARPGHARWSDESGRGWGYARLELGTGTAWRLEVEDALPQRAAPLGSPAEPERGLRLDLPDAGFAASLQAQVAHMRMGLVGRQTRPADPTSTPLASVREGASVVAALARAGRLTEARELSVGLAEEDFFGIAGSEADAPGLAIWALEEVAVHLRQAEYDRWLWPHVRRKAQIILDLLDTDRPVRRLPSGPAIPDYGRDPDPTLVAGPARGGLITGRADRQTAVLYVNAVSYRGLLDAASLAERMHEPAQAAAWRSRAGQLRAAWGRSLRGEGEPRAVRGEGGVRRLLRGGLPEASLERAYSSALWPTGIAADEEPTYRAQLERRWKSSRTDDGGFVSAPLRPAVDVAEAHQWLFLDRPDHVWATLRWLWDHQASPGLYTWWEASGWGPGDPQADPFRRWRRVRGWVKHPHITPHYGAAAEMVLLQLDMLAYVEDSGAEPLLVIAAGVPASWLAQPITVDGLLTRLGEVGWTWDGKEVRVTVRGAKTQVRLGSGFPAQTRLRVDYR
ncbi:MAG: hypothetical protein ACRELA_19390, partial [Candidatus Rokuibacteriota bacterium]